MTEPNEYDLLRELSGATLPAHVYVHVPFCASRCAYCDFFSSTDLSPQRVLPVTTAIVAEAAQWGARGLPGVLETLYLGGGTPTILASELPRVVRDVLARFPVRQSAEVTVEANPDSLTMRLAEELAASGVTRVSVGVQSFDDDDLAVLGRRHSSLAAEEACRLVLLSGMDLSLDLMCGVPGQTDRSWRTTLERAIETGARHMSVYPLAIEDGTPLAVAVEGGLVVAPDPDSAADKLLAADFILSEAGLPRYEVANYARPGNESRHNTAYWTGRPYIGVGPSSHGMLDAATAAVVNLVDDPRPGERVRYANVSDLDRWLLGDPPAVERLSRAQAAREDVMLGMRLVRGVREGQVAEAGLATVLESLESDGLVDLRDGRWVATRRGWLLGNEVFGRIWNAE
jgi:putative oxygen-independent coproporphyrinogen III oxidase